GRPTIPGSSLKGVARSITEAISPSCLMVTQVSSNYLPDNIPLGQRRDQACTPTHTCPACSIYGRIDQLGKARFGSATLVQATQTDLFSLSPLYAPRAEGRPAAYMDKTGKYKGYKFYQHARPSDDPRQPPVEVAPEKSQFQGRVDFENLTLGEVGLLFCGLGMIDPSIALKVGGGKPRGLGSMKVVRAELSLLGANHYLQAEADVQTKHGAELGEFVGQTVEAALKAQILAREQLLALAGILRFTDR
ncbi:MAG: hypothetical protein F6K39_47735, partial [Okeania sp. SIO3B3]|nr:hypothetical protein [Okeania sp. SIO3B3]